MEKHYVEKLIKIFERERKNENIISNDKYEKEIIKLFDLENLNLYVLQALRDSIVHTFAKLAYEEVENRFFYMSITSYTTTTIDNYIVKAGGEV